MGARIPPKGIKRSDLTYGKFMDFREWDQVPPRFETKATDESNAVPIRRIRRMANESESP